MSDNCTLFPEGNWTECCARHDARYANKKLTKYQADILLFRCVIKRGRPIIAAIMFVGVTLLGHWNYIKAQNENK